MNHPCRAWLGAICAISVLMAGCSQRTINSANSDAQHDVSAIGSAANRAAKEARPEVQKIEVGAHVSAALAAADLNGVHVHSNPNGVTLTGKMKTAADKKRADQIAQETLGPNKVVTDHLTLAS